MDRKRLITRGFWLMKAGGPFIGPRGGKWADPAHTIPWEEPQAHFEPKKEEPATKPKASAKEKKKTALQQAIELARTHGIPVEQVGPKSVALGGKAAFDRTLGKWNGQRGDAGRRIASASKALAWLKKHGEGQTKRNEFASQMDDRRKRGLALRGNTYPHREAIKASGGVWDRLEKVWLMPSTEAMQKMQKLMEQPKATTAQTEADRASPMPVAPRKPSERQLRYAYSLIERLGRDDFGTFTTYGYQRIRRGDLEKLSAQKVSAIIDNIRDEIGNP